MYVVKGGKEKGEEERNTTSYANSIQVSEETWESTHSEKRKKERKPQAMGKKKPSMRTSKEKKEKGATSYGKSSKCAPLGGCTPSRKLQEEIARRFWVCPLDLLPGIVPSCDIHLLTFGEQSVRA